MRNKVKQRVFCLLSAGFQEELKQDLRWAACQQVATKLWLPKVNFCRIGDLLVFILDTVRVLSDWVSWNKRNENDQSEEWKNTFKSQWKLRVKTTKQPKRRETRATESWLVLVLHLIGWESDASYLDQLQSEVRQNQSNPVLLSIQLHLDHSLKDSLHTEESSRWNRS